MKELGTTERQLHLLRLLQNRRQGVTVDDLSRQFGVSLKTVRRDLVRLRDAGFPIQEATEAHGRHRWSMHGESTTGAGLAFDEAFALALSTQCIGSLAGTEIGDAARSAMAKLRSGLCERTLDYCDRLARSITLLQSRGVDYADKADILEQILLGHEERRNVFIAYHSRGSTEPLTYPISPYAIRQYQNAVYIIGHSEQHDEVRCFKLDRIVEAERIEFPFTIPATFDADAYLGPAFGIYSGEPERVEIKIAAAAARPIAESEWHASQEVVHHADGTLTLTMQVAITPELESWILSLGPEAKVIEPESLAEAIAAKATAIAAQYQREVKHER
ncbi:HTH domain protein [Rubripirellula tenax]|uniref:HTH domain protein n=2 Tax=Rubripirellula tenax TaxID=2528015 RepID=A0A5C6F8C5_9BACT|nr:HTH domain protein [Rubripirellula tenax]